MSVDTQQQQRDVLPDVVTRVKRRFTTDVRYLPVLGTFVVIAAMIIAGGALYKNFLSPGTMSNQFINNAHLIVLAVGMTFVIITGGIDLSIGTGMALCAVMTGVFVTNMGLPVWVGVIGGILTGVLMGLINGVNITFLRLPPFIATLAMMMIAGGLALVISGVAPIYFSTSAPDFKKIALGVIIPGIPNAVLVTAVLAIIAYLVLSKTLLGRYTFAIGSNEEATRLSGVNTRRWTILIYMFAGAFTGVAGIVIASRLDSAQPQIGTGYELQAIAAVIIGGTSLLGGRGSILGTVIGALIMSVLVNGLRIMSIQPEWQNIVVGVVVLLAVFLDSLRNRQRT